MTGGGGAPLHPLILPSQHRGGGSTNNNHNEENNNDTTSIRGWDHSIITQLNNDDIVNPNYYNNSVLPVDNKLLLKNKRSNVTFHALAIDNVVYGTSSSSSPCCSCSSSADDANCQNSNTDYNNSQSSHTSLGGDTQNSNNDNSDTEIIKWRTPLPQNQQITTLTSNNDGSIIAIITSNNEVSLLKGCDGSILATRQIGPCAAAFGVGGGEDS